MKKIFAILVAVMTCVVLTVPTYAASLPSLEDVWTAELRVEYPYALVTSSELFLCSSEPYFYGSSTIACDGNYLMYTINTWTTPYTWKFSKGPISGLSYNKAVIKAASVPIYDTDGNLVVPDDPDFFSQPPLAVIIQGVTGEAMTAAVPEMAGTMKVLTLCGVGLMALLVVLKLFGKRSLIYRG